MIFYKDFVVYYLSAGKKNPHGKWTKQICTLCTLMHFDDQWLLCTVCVSVSEKVNYWAEHTPCRMVFTFCTQSNRWSFGTRSTTPPHSHTHTEATTTHCTRLGCRATGKSVCIGKKAKNWQTQKKKDPTFKQKAKKKIKNWELNAICSVEVFFNLPVLALFLLICAIEAKVTRMHWFFLSFVVRSFVLRLRALRFLVLACASNGKRIYAVFTKIQAQSAI